MLPPKPSRKASAEELAAELLGDGERGAAAAERVEHDVAALAGIEYRPFHQLHRLHGRVQIVLVGFIDLPHVTLIARPAPEVLSAVLPAVQDGFVLALVVGAPQGKRVLGPDDEGRPLATGSTKRRLQRIQFRGTHRDIHCPLGDREQVGAGYLQEPREVFTQVIVQDRAVRAPHLVFGRVGIVHIVRRVGEGHVDQLIAQQQFVIRRTGGITTQQAVVA